jgi:hypothetical protein
MIKLLGDGEIKTDGLFILYPTALLYAAQQGYFRKINLIFPGKSFQLIFHLQPTNH